MFKTRVRSNIINYNLFLKGMPRGLKETSSLIEIGFEVTESGPNTFTEARVDLQLNPLDNEVMIVYAVNLDPFTPDAVAGTDTSVVSSITKTSQTAVQNLSNSSCIANANLLIKAGGFVDGGVPFSTGAQETPPSTLEYVSIIATNDFYIQVQGVNNLLPKGMTGRLYCARAKADSQIYAALVQSELLS